MKRFGQVIQLDPEKKEEYIYLHQHPRPEINNMIKACNIANYSIFFKAGYLFAYFEYVGNDFEKDMEKMAADPDTQEWWRLVMPMQIPLEWRDDGEWWANMEEVYHLD